MKAFLFLTLCYAPLLQFAQVSFQITDGSQYYSGNATMQVYYLYVSGHSNAGMDQTPTCSDFSCYVTVYNAYNKTLEYYANVTIEASGTNGCGGSKTIQIHDIVPPNSARKVRVMPDVWQNYGDSPGSPGIAFTNTRYY